MQSTTYSLDEMQEMIGVTDSSLGLVDPDHNPNLTSRMLWSLRKDFWKQKSKPPDLITPKVENLVIIDDLL